MRLLLVLLLALAACGPRYTTAALGQYDDFEPFIRFDRRDLQIEIARQAYVSIVAVYPPAGGYDDDPVTFGAVYPLHETDQVHFPAGRHRLLARRTSFIDPRSCRSDEKPSLTGCRRNRALLPGLRGAAVPRGPTHYILFAAEELIDPFEVADELHFQALENSELAEVLRRADATIASPHIERVLLDRRGTPVWSAIYVATR